MGQIVPFPTDSCPCWRRRSMGQTLRSGSRASPCRPQREHNWCPGQVRAQQAVCLAFLAELSASGGGGAATGSRGDVQEGSTGVESQAIFAGHTLPLSSIPIVSSFALSATVSAAVVPSAPIFSPTMGGSSNSSLSLDSGGAEPMPGGYLTPDLHPLFPPPNPGPVSLAVPGRPCQPPQQARRGSSQRT